jgi:hypothetical protein
MASHNLLSLLLKTFVEENFSLMKELTFDIVILEVDCIVIRDELGRHKECS